MKAKIANAVALLTTYDWVSVSKMEEASRQFLFDALNR